MALFGESMEAFDAARPAPSSSSLPSSLASSAAPAANGLADHGSAPADGEKSYFEYMWFTSTQGTRSGRVLRAET